MARDSFVHLPDDIRQVEAPSKALQEKRQAWMEDEANQDKPMGDLLLWVQAVANEPHSGLTNRQRREWVRKERRLLNRPFTEVFFQNVVGVLSKLNKWFPEGSCPLSGGHGNPVDLTC
jgi:hypothetical protein